MTTLDLAIASLILGGVSFVVNLACLTCTLILQRR